ncbi:YwdI family protein [Bacillus sp. 31A1R]|uniref:YwdI family protein n=1 Tax=Robertmurraya mangrovi TaxID=3098077 RepID=A0ABU5IX62_9BACI|nr:YwdI family protein [Bacillus sp. 31A1R]MDZ5471752.1 YwdI family protein [Bacillus sp. 31A1R]
MSISIERLLKKMEEEIREAKASRSDSRIRERIHAIKTLCELALDQEGAEKPKTSRGFNSFPSQAQVPSQSPIIVNQPTKKVEMDNEANGDSLFDF